MPDHALLEQYLIPVQLVFAMLGMGLTMALREFAHVFKQPGALAAGILTQVVGIPLLAVALIEVFGLVEGWAVGLLLVSVVPGGAFSNLLTYFSRGNVPLSISVTTVTTLGCVFTVPLVLRLTAGEYLPADFQFPAGRIIRDIGLFLLLPLALGMVGHRIDPVRSVKVSKWAVRLSMLIIVVLTVSALGSGRIDVPAYGWQPPFIITTFALIVAFVSPQLMRLFGFYDDVTVALSIEVTLRNVGIGLLLVKFFFPGEESNNHVLYTCLFYAGLSTPLCLPVLFRHRARKSPALLRRPHRRPAAGESPDTP